MEFDPITGEPVEPRRQWRVLNLTPRRLATALTVLVGCVVIALVLFRVAGSSGNSTGTASREVLVEPGVRIRVEVLNATHTPRLARHATRVLRDRGFDVVAIGNADEQLDSTTILYRTDHPEWAALAATAMEGARVESRPDSSRYLDLTVLVGASWTPPPEALYP